ncbi:UDP-glucose dehydrogenase family protein [Mycobacterium antarcticum]|uniref:UDP-glucose dehydrogenase family protein n=1 Tax=unclassified Mycolicibacterium TaxID=2636767 RepID=UPI0024E0EB2E|nr:MULTISPECIES: UDP-glucose/GDP-mannose dehydrogenase family protein [unclassified Mycolicibacterium]
MRISVIGTGYLGAVHAACMATLGHDVVGYDTDAAKVGLLSSGVSPFFEPEFADILVSALATGHLRFTSSADEAIRGARLHFICVGTPQELGSDAADMRYVDAAVRTVADVADCDGLIIGKSTVPVGTAQRLADQLAGDGTRLELAWNPEFLREGFAVQDTLHPDRLVFGVTSEHAEKALLEVYGKIIGDGTPHITTDLATAEMVKVAANSFLATKISFINAMAEICEVANADVVTLSQALGYDERIGPRFLKAGLGFGGGCLPKDIRAFSARAGELGASDALTFLREIDKINMRRRDKVVAVAVGMLGGNFLSKNIAVLGAAFKPNSDDVRDSPALNVAAAMHLKGAAVRVHDPQAIPNARQQFPTLTYCHDIEDACRNTDLIVLATEWDEYRNVDPHHLRTMVRGPRLLDARNAVDYDYWSQAGWQVYALGRGALNAGTTNSSDRRLTQED